MLFDGTLDWAIANGVETSTFHVMTPYPGTGLFDRIVSENRLLHRDWDRYDTRQAVFRPRGMSVDQLEAGYWRAYKDFYTVRAEAGFKPPVYNKGKYTLKYGKDKPEKIALKAHEVE